MIFTKNGCGACHTFKAVPDANGKVGPNLDNLLTSAKAAGESLVPFIKESIVDPNKYIAPGYQPGVMPPSFGSTIPPNQLSVLVAFIAANTK